MVAMEASGKHQPMIYWHVDDLALAARPLTQPAEPTGATPSIQRRSVS
jgi:hypothetical protein